MKRLLAASAGVALSLMSGTTQAGPPQTTTLSRTTEVRRHDDIEPQSRLPVTRGANPAAARAPAATGLVLPTAYNPPELPSGPMLTPGDNPLPSGPPAPDGPPAEGFAAAAGLGFGNKAPLVYASGEYLLWWIKDSSYPVLATTGPFRLNPPGTNPPFVGGAGRLGQPGTVVLFGGEDVDNEERSGGRFTVGGFLPHTKLGFEASGFFLGERSIGFQATSGNAVIARPFFNLATQREDVQTTALPGISGGTLTIETPSELWGAEANLQCMLSCGCSHRIRLLGGFRYLDLEESLVVTEDIAFGPNVTQFFGPDFAFLNNARAFVVDDFKCRNQFYGGQLGLATQFRLGTWTLDMFGKVALGTTRQNVTILGGQVVDSPVIGRQAFQGGLLALSSNIGDRGRNVFSVVPEAGVTVGKQLGPVRLFGGYNFLFWSNVVRPGDQIDRNLNPALIPNFPVDPAQVVNPNPGQRPAFSFRDTGFWAQGLTFGMELSF